MREFDKVELSTEARRKLVMLYVGCKLCGINKGINNLANEIILAGATGKKLTFSTPYAIYEAEELIDFVYDYIYTEMEQLLYPKGKLNVDFIKSIGGINREKAIFLGLINRIFDFDFFENVSDRDIYVALDSVTILRLGEHHSRTTRCKFESTYKFTELIGNAVSEYEAWG